MLLKNYPGCCSAKILCDFGGTNTSFGRWGEVSREDLVKELIAKNLWHNKGFITATTNFDQKEANAFLRYMGFKRRKGVIGNHMRFVYEWYIETIELLDNIRAIKAGIYNKKL